MDRFSFLNAVHTEFIEQLYQQYLEFPDSVEPSWKAFFQGYDFANETYDGEKITLTNTSSNQSNITTNQTVNQSVLDKINKEFKVINLINSYRHRGHLFTKTNPIRTRRTYTPDLSIENFGLVQSDLQLTFSAGEIIGFKEPQTLETILAKLNKMYCDSIGIEYMFVREPDRASWIQNWINNNQNHPTLTHDEKIRAFRKISNAVAFENFKRKRY